MEKKLIPFNVVSYMVALSNGRVGDFPTSVLDVFQQVCWNVLFDRVNL